mmetsp:Transcript_45032/g.86091  ORF Transcript_45032/g.86091 Transcript_45032/m.86091 type:complete len:87 (+) Transcript_45032:2327-2587(+)
MAKTMSLMKFHSKAEILEGLSVESPAAPAPTFQTQLRKALSMRDVGRKIFMASTREVASKISAYRKPVFVPLLLPCAPRVDVALSK